MYIFSLMQSLTTLWKDLTLFFATSWFGDYFSVRIIKLCYIWMLCIAFLIFMYVHFTWCRVWPLHGRSIIRYLLLNVMVTISLLAVSSHVILESINWFFWAWYVFRWMVYQWGERVYNINYVLCHGLGLYPWVAGV